MRFAQPTALWFLVILPLIGFLFGYGGKRQRAFLQSFGELHLLLQTPSRCSRLQQPWVIVSLILLTFGCTLLALSDPRYPVGPFHIRSGALDVVMVLDVSKSMGAEDYGNRSRLAQAREMARHMLTDLRGNRVGLVTYAGSSFRQANLTQDLDALAFILSHWVTIESTGIGGSNLSLALETALDELKSATKDSPRDQLVLLFSDGGAEPADAFAESLNKARQQGVRVAAFGLGRIQSSRIPQYDQHDAFVDYLKVDGQTLTTSLNEDILRRVENGGAKGVYVRIQHGQEWRHLLRRADIAGTMFERDEQKLFQPFLLVGLLAFAAQTLVTRL